MTVELTGRQRRDATAYHRRRVVDHERHEHRDEYIRTLRSRVGLGAGGDLDDEFAQKLAEWQEEHPNSVARRFDGRLQPRTEAHLGIQIDEMERLAQRMESYWREGGIFYDSWGNDGRDNDHDGSIDEEDEHGPDGGHYRNQVYRGFLIEGSTGSTSGTRIVPPVDGNYEYRFCSDIVARALRDTGVVRGGYARVYEFNGAPLNQVAYKFVRSREYPEKYLRGDIIGYSDPGRSPAHHGGHIGVVVQEDDTSGGSAPPLVIDLPGPSSYGREGGTPALYQANGEQADGRRPGVRGDIVRERWPQFRLAVGHEHQFLIRLVCTLLHRRGRRPILPRDRPRG